MPNQAERQFVWSSRFDPNAIPAGTSQGEDMPPKSKTTREPLVEIDPRYELFKQYLVEQVDEKFAEIPPDHLQIAIRNYGAFQRSDMNRQANEERKAGNAEEREERARKAEERRQAAAEKREVAEARRAEREAAKAAKAEAKAAEPAKATKAAKASKSTPAPVADPTATPASAPAPAKAAKATKRAGTGAKAPF